ncbi:signal peptidase I [Ruminococcus sp. NK3A76]|uniref:signal peptidase I n=1 Tax=Ruminococcus sp. NK3A76 TaxID=877411 RepID=UPI000567A225|nr:signal peptidase I [Ruminococcus sp. NK3A76]
MSEQLEEINKNTESENKPSEDNKKEHGFDIVNELIEWVESFVFAIFMVILVLTFIVRVVEVEGPSMEDTLHDGDRLLLTHFNYTPERGDIVVLNSSGLDETIIKRVIAVEGDTISIDFTSGTVTLNGEVLKEDYIKEITLRREGRDIDNLKIGEGQVFVMGDNRNHSTDSRSEAVGVVNTDDILGKAVFRIYPVDNIGKVS